MSRSILATLQVAGLLSLVDRWSERSENHRNAAGIRPHPESGAKTSETPVGVRNHFHPESGGLHCVATTGYCLAALQAEPSDFGH
jgi:hypothetical protein